MKMFEKILDRRFRKLITFNNMEFGFSSGKGTLDAVFIIQLQKKTPRNAQGFVLYVRRSGKAYDRVPRDQVY